VIDRHLVGKDYPLFRVILSAELLHDLRELVRPWLRDSEEPPLRPSVWPGFLALRGSAGFAQVWEDAGVNPLELHLIMEEAQLFEDPPIAQEIVGLLRIEDITERMEPDRGIEDEIRLSVTFRNTAGREVASYHCAYRIPLAVASTR